MELGPGLSEKTKFLEVPNIQYNLEIPNLISYDPSEAEQAFERLQLMSDGEHENNGDSILKKSIITPDFMQKEYVPPLRVSKYKLKRQRREERQQKTGKGWHEMRAPEMTEELENELKVLEMRGSLDPKRYYNEKRGKKKRPKFFQIGRLIEGPGEFYSSRLPKKARKSTMVEELLADAEFQRYNKTRFTKLQIARRRGKFGYRNKYKKKRF
ncbi:Deoxynucleotidyltransferase terminal-interacting protein 2-like [Oopsacas minuta]|uniref:Deoxynucleotidyltransferase terminal-interacting protein 2-like n=1 Tax=Oopsacas minuta TaxID=111878 RepID=A0AAV7JTF7_9METZ|nr:Deoxynucleotidyltransferase terminal-interacting protein 2-like [Oopsacas minuta]